MSTTEERMKVEAPVENEHGLRWWIVGAIGIVALVSGVLIGTLTDVGDEETSDGASTTGTEEPSGDSVDIAERWGNAWEAGDADAVLALYSPDTDERYIVDQTGRTVWRDVEAAIDQINSTNDFDRFELVRLEDFGISMVAEYEVQSAPEGDSRADVMNIMVVFISDPEGLIGSDIYVPAWSDIFRLDDEPRENGAWSIIN